MNVFLDITYNNNEGREPIIKAQSVAPENLRTFEVTKQKVKNKKIKGNKYRWSQVENDRYIKFLIKRGKLFSLSFKERKKIQINKKMSASVKTRTAQQCHTHHQKMMLKFQSLDKIIQNYRTSARDPKIDCKIPTKVVRTQEKEYKINEQSLQQDKKFILQEWLNNQEEIVFQPIEHFENFQSWFDI